MGYSGLVTGVIPSPFCSKRTHTVDSVAIHTMAGNLTAENCGYWFQNPTCNASSNYGIGSDGKIYGYVDEDSRSWCTSSSGVDNRAITVEVASTTSSEPYTCTDEAYNSLIDLLVDVCTRHNMYLRWTNDKPYAVAASKGGPVDQQNMFVHRWFHSGKSCPGAYLFERQGSIANEVNSRLRRQGKSIPLYQYTSTASTSSGKSKLILIGDSRTVHMKLAVGNNDNVWSCKSAMGLSWMKSTGVPAIESKVTSDSAVCILMGINDMLLVKPSDYYNYINECAARWVGKGAAVYYVSVNPVRLSGYYQITNEKIAQWNQDVRNGLSSNVGYIDTYSSIISNFVSIDGLHYDNATSLNIYQLILSAVHQGQTQMYSNSAVVGGRSVQIDYTRINPYIITIDRSTLDLDYDNLKSVGVVGAIVETGFLYNTYHVKVEKFKQPQFDVQRKQLVKANLDYGYFFIGRARSTAEALSEIYELSFIIRSYPPKLGVWIHLDLSNNVQLNDSIISCYQKQLIRLGLVQKIGLYTTKEALATFTWDKFKADWLLWIVDHVENSADIKKELDPSFFDVDGV